jgi:uncharacterized membrane protein (DUF4010 family)
VTAITAIAGLLVVRMYVVGHQAMVIGLSDVLGILIAALGGAAVGLEREWSGHASGPNARFAGIRTLTLLGLLAGLAGALWSAGVHTLAAVLLAGTSMLIVAAYFAASHVEVDGTTEVASFIVLAAGAVAGMHEIRLASGAIAVTTLLLVEKSKLHSLVERIDDASLRAAFRFAVMAVVFLPLLPSGPYGPLGGMRPRQLWAMVLFFSGLSFAGYLARRAVGTHRGYPITGMLGGLISSTNVTLSFARTSRKEAGIGIPLGSGVLGACAVMCARVIIATGVLNVDVSIRLVPYLVGPLVIAGLIAWLSIRNQKELASGELAASNPLQFRLALQMAVLFQIVLFAIRWTQSIWGEPGVFISAGVLGLTDIDALVVSMAKDTGAQLPAATAATAIAIGVLANTLLKLALGLIIGVKQFRRVVGIGLSAVAVACALSILWLR